jgi:hypothetical protein
MSYLWRGTTEETGLMRLPWREVLLACAGLWLMAFGWLAWLPLLRVLVATWREVKGCP